MILEVSWHGNGSDALPQQLEPTNSDLRHLAEGLRSHEVKAQKIAELVYQLDYAVYEWVLLPRHTSAASLQFSVCKAAAIMKPMLDLACHLEVKLGHHV